MKITCPKCGHRDERIIVFWWGSGSEVAWLADEDQEFEDLVISEVNKKEYGCYKCNSTFVDGRGSPITREEEILKLFTED